MWQVVEITEYEDPGEQLARELAGVEAERDSLLSRLRLVEERRASLAKLLNPQPTHLPRRRMF